MSCQLKNKYHLCVLLLLVTSVGCRSKLSVKLAKLANCYSYNSSNYAEWKYRLIPDSFKLKTTSPNIMTIHKNKNMKMYKNLEDSTFIIAISEKGIGCTEYLITPRMDSLIQINLEGIVK